MTFRLQKNDSEGKNYWFEERQKYKCSLRDLKMHAVKFHGQGMKAVCFFIRVHFMPGIGINDSLMVG